MSEDIYKSSNRIVYPYEGMHPEIHESVFLADGVRIVGDVTIGKDSSVWYNSVVRGDVHYVKIGEKTNVQDLCMLHVTNGKFPLNIGSKVTIGHSVKLHGCTIEDLALLGIGSIVLDGAVVEQNSIVAAGAVIKPGFVVPSGKLAAGIPARIVRDLTQQEIDDLSASAERYKKYTEITKRSLVE